jgi:riboflavin biosynthesis pyrimidine reductase
MGLSRTIRQLPSGAITGQEFLAAGLVDELSIHLVPVLFESGTRMFESLGDTHIALEPLATIQTPRATHLRLRIAR